MNPSNEYRARCIRKKIIETPSTATFLFEDADEAPSFVAGQFVNVSLPELGPEAKSYSISSAPGEPLAISVCAAGAFSRAILSRGEGDELLLSKPLGYFYPESDETPILFCAGGIGITPCMSIMRDRARRGARGSILVAYSSRSVEECVFKRELDLLAENRTIGIEYFFTRTAGAETPGKNRRIAAEDLAALRARAPDAAVFLCGGIAFVRDMRLALKSVGVPEGDIYTESFF